jgi:DNA gyrase subunit B
VTDDQSASADRDHLARGMRRLDPEQRTMLRVTIDDAMKAEEIFSTLMGDEVAPRKKWIQGHATQVKNLDI